MHTTQISTTVPHCHDYWNSQTDHLYPVKRTPGHKHRLLPGTFDFYTHFRRDANLENAVPGTRPPHTNPIARNNCSCTTNNTRTSHVPRGVAELWCSCWLGLETAIRRWFMAVSDSFAGCIPRKWNDRREQRLLVFNERHSVEALSPCSPKN